MSTRYRVLVEVEVEARSALDAADYIDQVLELEEGHEVLRVTPGAVQLGGDRWPRIGGPAR